MIPSAWVTLRQHRFEVGVAAAAAILAAAMGLSIAVGIASLGVSQDCLDAVRASQDGSSASEECRALVRAGFAALGETYFEGEGSIPISIMGVLPFVVGLLGGIPIVARELEERTAQTAWSLNASRNRWLIRQAAPIALVLGSATVLAALAAMPVADDWVRWRHGGAASLIGQHGPLVLVRAFAAFGAGLATGVLFARTLPAFVLGIILILAILFAAGQARDAWLSRLPLSVLAERSTATGEWIAFPGEVRAVGWVSPDGKLLSREEARQVATDAGVPPADPYDEQDVPASIWLADHGYAEVPIGVSDAHAVGWAPFDGLIFGTVGVAGVATAVALVNRRRPAS